MADEIITGISADGLFRVFAVDATQTVQEAQTRMIPGVQPVRH